MILKLCSGNLALKMTVLRQINIPKIRQTYAAANLEKPETYFPGVSILCFHVPVALQCMRSLLGAEQGSCGPCIFFVGKFSDIEALPCRRMMDFLFCLILMCAVLSVPTLQFFFFLLRKSLYQSSKVCFVSWINGSITFLLDRFSSLQIFDEVVFKPKIPPRPFVLISPLLAIY